MEIYTKQDPADFSAIELKITIQSQEELDMLRDMLSMNEDIPKMVYKPDWMKCHKLCIMMSDIHAAIRKF